MSCFKKALAAKIVEREIIKQQLKDGYGGGIHWDDVYNVYYDAADIETNIETNGTEQQKNLFQYWLNRMGLINKKQSQIVH